MSYSVEKMWQGLGFKDAFQELLDIAEKHGVQVKKLGAMLNDCSGEIHKTQVDSVPNLDEWVERKASPLKIYLAYSTDSGNTMLSFCSCTHDTPALTQLAQQAEPQ